MTNMIVTEASPTDRLIKLSFNPHLIDKIPPDDKRWMTHGFDPYELTIEQVCHFIDLGVSYSYQFKGGIRRTENFLGADLISVDIDGGRTIGEALADPIVQAYGSVWYPTPSHTPDQHRFRLLFILPRTITDAKEIKAASRALSRRLGGDMSATDAARLFYGTTGSEPVCLGGQLTEEYLAELIEDGRTAPVSDSISDKRPSTSRSKLTLDLDQDVKLADGSLVVLRSIKDKASVHCPYHPDGTASAFVAFNSRRIIYLHCTSCKLTWWPDRSLDNRLSFETAAINLKQKSVQRPSKKVALELFDDDDPSVGYSVDHVTLHNSKYINISQGHPGVTFIKSPKGSGKTEYLKTLIQRFVNRYPSFKAYEEDSFDSEQKIYHDDSSVLLIGHRQALIGELCERLGLNCYLADPKRDKSETERRKKRYGVCLDSLWKVKHKTYDLIVIDEAEQVLSHFLSDTIGTDRFTIFLVFAELLKKASRVVLLDADLGWITFKSVTQVMNGDGESAKQVPVHIHINQWKPAQRSYQLYALQGQMLTVLKERILEGKRIYISSNSKRKIQQLDDLIGEFEKENDLTVLRIMITSENSSSKDIQNFIKNIKVETLRYQVILSSPSLGTGVDITFENDAQHIDCVFGFYENRINSHFEIDQQLGRVRHPAEVNVWVSPTWYNFETELAPILKDIEDQYLDIISQSRFDMNAMTTDYGVSGLVMLAARVVSEQRRSKNNLRGNFISYKSEQGWEAIVPPDDEDAEGLGQEWMDHVRGALAEKWADRMMAARTLNLYDYTRVRDRFEKLNLPISPEVLDCYRRTGIELFYCREISRDLIELDDGSRYRDKVRRFRHMINEVTLRDGRLRLKANDNRKEQSVQLRTIKDFRISVLLLNSLFKKTPIFEGTKFISGLEYSTPDLADFAAAVANLSVIIQGQLDIPVRKDVAKKPVQQMKALLHLIGLDQVNVREQNINKKRTYFYEIEPTFLTVMTDLVAWQSQNEQVHGDDADEHNGRYSPHWPYLNKLHGFEYDTEQREWLYPGLTDGGELIPRGAAIGHRAWADQFSLHGRTGWFDDEAGSENHYEEEFADSEHNFLWSTKDTIKGRIGALSSVRANSDLTAIFEDWK